MFYFFNIVFLLLFAVMYGGFRDGVRAAHKISPKKRFRGFRNALWFEEVRESKKLGLSYYVNKTFTILYLALAPLVLLLGLFPFARTALALSMSALGLFLIPMHIYAWIHTNRKQYGRAFVLLYRCRQTGTYHTVFLDILGSGLPLFVIALEYLLLFAS